LCQLGYSETERMSARWCSGASPSFPGRAGPAQDAPRLHLGRTDGQLTTPSHNEVRLMAGSRGLSTLVSLMNNGTEGKPTSANLLGPFWRKGSPTMKNGESIVRSPTPGPPLFFTGRIVDTDGNVVVGAEVDVWHASPAGLYENQDPEQAASSSALCSWAGLRLATCC
jgi:protocatechuate 3,4-dioxygenase beta subunit